MTKIIVFTNHKNISCLSKIEKSRSISIEYIKFCDFKKQLDQEPANTFVYYDISSIDEKDQKSLFRFLSTKSHHDFGIIDPHGKIEDIAQLFYLGASDYIGKALQKQIIEKSRIESAVEFYENDQNDDGCVS